MFEFVFIFCTPDLVSNTVLESFVLLCRGCLLVYCIEILRWVGISNKVYEALNYKFYRFNCLKQKLYK